MRMHLTEYSITSLTSQDPRSHRLRFPLRLWNSSCLLTLHLRLSLTSPEPTTTCILREETTIKRSHLGTKTRLLCLWERTMLHQKRSIQRRFDIERRCIEDSWRIKDWWSSTCWSQFAFKTSRSWFKGLHCDWQIYRKALRALEWDQTRNCVEDFCPRMQTPDYQP